MSLEDKEKRMATAQVISISQPEVSAPPESLWPPATSTIPDRGPVVISVAMCAERGVFILPVSVHCPVAGS